MLTRGKRMIQLVSQKDKKTLGQLEFKQLPCETTKGVKLKDVYAKLVSLKDKKRLGQLEFKQLSCETTKGVKLKDVDVKELKKQILESVSQKAEHTQEVDSQNNDSNSKNTEIVLTDDTLHDKSITGNVNVPFTVIVRPPDLQPADIQFSKQSSYNLNASNPSCEMIMDCQEQLNFQSNNDHFDGLDRSEKVEFTTLANVVSNHAELNDSLSDKEPFSDFHTQEVDSQNNDSNSKNTKIVLTDDTLHDKSITGNVNVPSTVIIRPPDLQPADIQFSKQSSYNLNVSNPSCEMIMDCQEQLNFQSNNDHFDGLDRSEKVEFTTLKNVVSNHAELNDSFSDKEPFSDFHTQEVDSQNNDSNSKRTEIVLTDHTLQDKGITGKVNVLSTVIIRPPDLQPADIQFSEQSSYNLNASNPSCEMIMDCQEQVNFQSNNDHFDGLDRSEKVELTTLTNVVSNHAELNDSFSNKEPFSDSGSEYIPPSVSSTDNELGFSSDSNHSFEGIDNGSSRQQNSKKLSEFNVFERVARATANTQNKREQKGRKKKLTRFNEVGEVKSSSKNLQGKLKRDKRENCVYCEKNVTNFSRHLMRNHGNEFEVIKIVSLPKNSEERKCLFDEIRKKGNFINSYGEGGFINPVRRPRTLDKRQSTDYLPCSGCKGFFLRTYLHRHMKKCYKKDQETDSRHAQANGLTTLHLSGENNFEDLQLHIFPRMQPDDITKIVMNDFIIKFYGQRYYRCHKEKHLINTVSQRMRELARFLTSLQNMKPKLNQLVDYLKPCYFDQIVNATNEIFGYDPANDSFKSPSLALRWATVLKQVCDTAMFAAVKEGDMVKNKEIKILKQMIESQFRFFVSTNANKDLHSKNWKKGSMLPLTEDVIKINQFVVAQEEMWSKELDCDPSNSSYVRNLSEALLAHVILLNRKRSGEAQRITIEDYTREDDESVVQDIYQSLSATEKVLVNNVKRIIIRGKKGRAVPVIFTKEMQRHTEILLKSRKNVACSNPCLFANPSTEDGFLWSYKVLKKFAIACNVKNIQAITATCLRKHIATIAQIISMEDNDLEQLSTHLGHEKATHLNYYRKTDDKLQIAKVSKLLLLMEKKSMGEYRGKSLENIDLEIPELDDAEDDESLSTSSGVHRDIISMNVQLAEEEPIIREKRNRNSSIRVESYEDKSPTSNKNKVKKGPVRTLVPWTSQQKRFAQIFFRNHLALKKPPKKGECEELQKLHSPTFKNKTWAQIKIFIVNLYNKK